jgi:hypothetical protein
MLLGINKMMLCASTMVDVRGRASASKCQAIFALEWQTTIAKLRRRVGPQKCFWVKTTKRLDDNKDSSPSVANGLTTGTTAASHSSHRQSTRHSRDVGRLKNQIVVVVEMKVTDRPPLWMGVDRNWSVGTGVGNS